MSDGEEAIPPVEDFKFKDWVAKLNLSRKVTQSLRTEELVSKDTIKLLQERDLKEMGLPIGAIKLIMAEIATWNVSEESENVDNGVISDERDKSDKSDSDILMGAGTVSKLEEELDAAVLFYKNNAYSRNTKRTYCTHRKSYLSFCSRLGYCPVPASSVTICRYVAHLAKSLKFNSVKQYLNIVRLLHAEWNLPNPIINDFNIKYALQGIKRHLGDRVIRKKPVTPELLHNIRSHLDLTLSLDATVWAVCLALFYGLLRRSNVLSISGQKFNSEKHLRRQDVKFLPWGVLLNIRWSKVLQYQSKTLEIPLPSMDKSDMCPVKAFFKCFILSKHAAANGPAFVFLEKGGVKPLTSELFLSRIRDCLTQSGINPGQYGTHSFRRGGATFCYAIGLSPDAIKIAGNWTSNCYQRYLDNETQNRYQIIRKMQSAV